MALELDVPRDFVGQASCAVPSRAVLPSFSPFPRGDVPPPQKRRPAVGKRGGW